MNGAWLLLALALAGLAALVASIRSRRALARSLAANWGKGEVEALDGEALEDIASYWRELSASGGVERPIDDITWNDLDMDAVFTRMNRAESCVGEGALYAALRDVGLADEELARRKVRVRALSANTDERLKIRLALRRIGGERYHGASAYLFHPASKRHARGGVYLALALAPIAFLLAGLIWPVCFAGILAMFAVNAVIYYRTGKIWMSEICAVRHMASVLRAAKAIKAACPPEMAEEARELDELCARMRPVARWNALFAMQRQGSMDVFTDYARILFLLDMLCLTRLSAFFERHNQELRRMYALVGEIDACVAIAAHRASRERWVEPEFIGDLRVEATALGHPLLREPVRNDIIWDGCALVTGSNASGKSTFVKALALNAILAQTVLTCDAERFRLPRSLVMTSMALRDDVRGGESYFIVEIKSLRRVLEALNDERPTLCFIDEILRGTNTIERIAASSALLRRMPKENCLCMAATHDRELCEMLTEYRQLHFREEITPNGMTFSYRLMEGPSDTRNAIALLDTLGFPRDVVADARSAAARFDETRSWTAREDKITE